MTAGGSNISSQAIAELPIRREELAGRGMRGWSFVFGVELLARKLR